MATSLFDQEADMHDVPVYVTVRDTRLARKIYPDFKDNGDGTITIIKEWVKEGKFSGTYTVPTSGIYEITAHSRIYLNGTLMYHSTAAPFKTLLIVSKGDKVAISAKGTITRIG